MQVRSLHLVSLLVGISMVSAILTATPYAEAASKKQTVEPSQKAPATLTAESIILEVNKARAEAGLAPLVTNPLLMEAAQKKADDLVSRKYFAHDTPEGVKFYTLVRAVGYDYMHTGENLAVHYKTPKEVVTAWLNSPGHRANLLGKQYEDTGIGLSYGERKGRMGWYVVELFGTQF